MNPGYYLSELGNFQVWYPANFFEKGKQRLEIVDSTGETKVDYDLSTANLVYDIFEFEFIDEL